MNPIILCIDDVPTRYINLASAALARGVVAVVTCREEEVDFYLKYHYVFGICLDHDMPFQNGLTIAQKFLIERSIPVAIVSHNPPGVKSIADILNDYEVENIISPAQNSIGWAESIVNWFETKFKIRRQRYPEEA